MTSDICALHSDCYWLSAVRECRANELLASAVKRVKCSGNAWAKFSRFLCSSYHFSYVLTEMGMHVFISFPIESDFQPMQIMQCLWNFRGSRFTRTTTSGSLHRFFAVTNGIFLWGTAVPSLILWAFEELNHSSFLTYKICCSLCG